MTDQTATVKLQPAPVYVSFTAIVSVIAKLRDNGMPFPIDEIALNEVSQSMRRQVLSGLRFLQLIDAEGAPQPSLKTLILAYSTAAWPQALASVLRVAYAPLFERPIQTMTPSTFQRVFRSIYPTTDNVTRKAITFFINAARSGRIELKSENFETRRRSPGMANSYRSDHDELDAPFARSAVGIEASQARESEPLESPDIVMTGTDRNTAQALLMDMLDEERMSQVEQAAVWTLMKYARRCLHPE